MRILTRGLAAIAAAFLAGGLTMIVAIAAEPAGAPDSKPEGVKTPAVKVDDASFKCLLDMTAVGNFYVDNLAGNLGETIKVAKAGHGEYPQGAVIQLVPNEAMIKQQKGFSPVTNDWEFFYIDVNKDGSRIFRRGFTEVNNRFEMNCFACHVKARPEFDLTCRTDQGCEPIPFTRAMFEALQRADPRCKNAPAVSAEDKAALGELAALVKELTSGSSLPKSEDKKN